MSNCPHGKYLGGGCKKCGKLKGDYVSPIHRVIIKLIGMMMVESNKSDDKERKATIQEDIRKIYSMRAHYQKK